MSPIQELSVNRHWKTIWALAIGLSFLPASASPRAAELAATLARVQQRNGSPPYRQLAPGVLTVVPPGGEPEDTHVVRSLTGLLAAAEDKLDYTPKFLPASETLKEMAAKAEFRRTIWGLEFSFKPLRMIEADLPQQGSVATRRTQVWYLLFRVRNIGQHLRPVKDESGIYQISHVDDVGEPLYFVPRFELFSHEFKKCYADQILPGAAAAIQQREDPSRKLYNVAEIAAMPLPLSGDNVDRGVWGVATWNGTNVVDPRIDFFSVFVHGLTNAYRWDDEAGVTTPRRDVRSKALQINFWRPGDEIDPVEREVRLGVPAGEEARYGVELPVDYRWVYVRPCE